MDYCIASLTYVKCSGYHAHKNVSVYQIPSETTQQVQHLVNIPYIQWLSDVSWETLMTCGSHHP